MDEYRVVAPLDDVANLPLIMFYAPLLMRFMRHVKCLQIFWAIEVATSPNRIVCTEAVRVQFPVVGQLSSCLFTRPKPYDLEGNFDDSIKTNFLCNPSPQVLHLFTVAESSF